MSDARGIYLLRMDKRGRIFVKVSMRRYFGLEKGEDSGAICNIGLPREPDVNALVLLNDTIADEISSTTREVDIMNFDVVASEIDSSPSKRVQDQFRPVEIKSNRIQFNKYERKVLNLPEHDNRVIVQGGGIRFVVWPAAVFAEKYPDLYERFSDEDDDE